MLSALTLNAISKLGIVPANETALFRLIRDAPAVFADFERAISLYLERSTSLDEDTATDAEKTHIYSSLVGFPAKHSAFIRDVLEILDDFTVVHSLPTAFANLLTAVQAYIASYYPNAGNYYLFHTDSVHLSIVSDLQDADSHVDEYDYQDAINGTALAQGVTGQAIKKCLNDLIWDVKTNVTARLESTTALPFAIGHIVAKVYLIIKFLRDEIGLTYAEGLYVTDSQLTDLAAAAAGVLTNY